MKEKLIMLAIFIVMGAVFVFLVMKFKELGQESAEIEENLLIPYMSLIQRQDYDEAYELLGPTYQGSESKADFAAAHKKHVQELGRLLSWEYLDLEHGYDPSTEESTLGLRYTLTFEKGQAFVIYRASPDTQPVRIVEILGTTGPSDSMKHEIW